MICSKTKTKYSPATAAIQVSFNDPGWKKDIFTSPKCLWYEKCFTFWPNKMAFWTLTVRKQLIFLKKQSFLLVILLEYFEKYQPQIRISIELN